MPEFRCEDCRKKTISWKWNNIRSWKNNSFKIL